MPKQRLNGDVIGGQRGRVRARGTFAGCCPPRFERDDGFVAADSPRDVGEPSGVAERFHVQQDDGCGAIALPILQEVVHGDISFVADADEGRKPEVQSPRSGEQGQPQGAALRGHRNRAGEGKCGGEGGVESDRRVGIQDAEAVRPDHPHTMLPYLLQQLCLQATSFLSDFGESGGDDHQRADSGRGAVVYHGKNGFFRHGNDDEIGRFRQGAE